MDALFELKRYEQLVSFLHAILAPTAPHQEYTPELQMDTSRLLQKLGYSDEHRTFDFISEASQAHIDLSNLVNDSEVPKDNLFMKTQIRNLSVITSMLLMKVMAEIKPVDHVEKYRLKVQYIEEDLKIFDALLGAYYMYGLVSGTITGNEEYEKASDVDNNSYGPGNPNRENLKKVHPYCKILMELKEQTASTVLKYASGNTFRPSEPSYNSFFKDCKHFTNSVLAAKSVEVVTTQLRSTITNLHESIRLNQQNREVINKVRTTVKEVASWLFSVQSFYKRIESTYSEAFPDLAKPLQASLSQITYSVTALSDFIKEMVVKIEQGSLLGNAVVNLMLFPNAIPKAEEREKHLNRFAATEFVQLLNRNVLETAQDEFAADIEGLE